MHGFHVTGTWGTGILVTGLGEQKSRVQRFHVGMKAIKEIWDSLSRLASLTRFGAMVSLSDLAESSWFQSEECEELPSSTCVVLQSSMVQG